MQHSRGFRLAMSICALVIPVLVVSQAFAQSGSIKVQITPKQSYIYVDGAPARQGSGRLSLAAGEHTLDFHNFGYRSATQKVTVEAHKTKIVNVTLDPIAGNVSGPWGRIQIEGPKKDVVLLNGKNPNYFVGHVDEFNNDFIWKQELLVPPGTYQVTLLQPGTGKEDYSGSVTVAENQRQIIYVARGKTVTKDWSRGKKLSSVPRFKAGMSSATVAVPKPTAQFSAANAQVYCGDSTQLKWSSSDAVEGEVSEIGKVAPSGEQTVSPKQTTTYTYKAMGPGGEANSSATVNVDNTINASLEVTPQEVQYKRVGDKVVEQGTATLSWSTTRAKTVEIDPLGSVEASGSRQVTPAVTQTQAGPVDQTEKYTLKAVNACGAEETRTASLHIVGSIAPAVSVTASDVGMALASVFFPTAYPEAKRPEAGLVKSQEESLGKLADAFKKFLAYDATAKLVLDAHADVRGGKRYNQELSERRAARVKDYLVSQGVPAEAVETKAYGEEQQLSRADVKGLEEKNPTPPPKARAKAAKGDWLAYNRRVDITLEPAGLKSSQYYPHGAPDSGLLWQQPKPRWRMVEKMQ